MRIAFLLYDQLTQLDMTGPAQVLSRMPGATVEYVAKTMEPVMSDCRLALMPTMTLAEAGQFDFICVPGGFGCSAAMNDDEILGWLRAQAPGCAWITSVCTGSLILAAAGLLKGRKAGCHWAWGDYLPLFGAEWVQERTVFDGNIISAGGVTSGIDFAFRVLEHLHGPDVAASLRLGLEYDPESRPGGTPATARPEIIAQMRAFTAERLGHRDAEMRAAAARLMGEKP
ncbi:DJ-1/PfpI family protein [Sandarakinorhabdus sp. AAP62]|uniref:DJ-1/PfpI family protein n=1 Tax=Sandarakinorhabdus sp. AAP62 TaxID=1248916 RepID=UPI00030FDD51|nr:DJ-1/PfpI family protein [Sandarakinorhabdus sp. AAP62]